MNILITGGIGFIGSHLSERLIKNHHVIVIDDLSTGLFENIEYIQDDLEIYIDSIFNKKLMEELIRKSDIVIHLAAAVGVKLIVDKPTYTLENNIRGTEIIMKYASIYRKKVIITSSSEVYGKQSNLPFKETDDSVFGTSYKNRWGYACSKLIDEFLAFAYYKEKNTPICIIRLFNTVGPRQVGRYGMVIPRFVKQALSNSPISVYGDGTQKRCFTNVKDVVKSIDFLINSEDSWGKIFNIGSDNEISIKELAQKVKTLTNSESEIQFIPFEEVYGKGFEDMERRIPDVSELKNTINYTPDTSLEDTLNQVIDYYKKQV